MGEQISQLSDKLDNLDDKLEFFTTKALAKLLDTQKGQPGGEAGPDGGSKDHGPAPMAYGPGPIPDDTMDKEPKHYYIGGATPSTPDQHEDTSREKDRRAEAQPVVQKPHEHYHEQQAQPLALKSHQHHRYQQEADSKATMAQIE